MVTIFCPVNWETEKRAIIRLRRGKGKTCMLVLWVRYRDGEAERRNVNRKRHILHAGFPTGIIHEFAAILLIVPIGGYSLGLR